jgi:hypothetical protein
MFAWEHIGRINNTNVRPAIMLNYISDKCELFFETLGYVWAKISSFFSLLNFDAIFITLQELCKSIGRVIGSPSNIVVGYLTVLYDYDRWRMVMFGSSIILAIIYLIFQQQIKIFVTKATKTSYLKTSIVSIMVMSMIIIWSGVALSYSVNWFCQSVVPTLPHQDKQTFQSNDGPCFDNGNPSFPIVISMFVVCLHTMMAFLSIYLHDDRTN